MNSTIKGFVILGSIAILGGLYAWLGYYQANDDYISIPEQGRDTYHGTKKPLKKFEKDMEQRIEDAKSRGIDLTQEKPKRNKSH